jgi:hypothetical protein
VVLAVNGVRREAAGVHPSMTLLEFLRTQTPVRGPKLGCGEGTPRPLPSSIFSVFPVSLGSIACSAPSYIWTRRPGDMDGAWANTIDHPGGLDLLHVRAYVRAERTHTPFPVAFLSPRAPGPARPTSLHSSAALASCPAQAPPAV